MKKKIKFIRYEISDEEVVDDPLILGVYIKVKATIFMEDDSIIEVNLEPAYRRFIIPNKIIKKYFNMTENDEDYEDLHDKINDGLNEEYKKLFKKITNIKQEGVIKF